MGAGAVLGVGALGLASGYMQKRAGDKAANAANAASERNAEVQREMYETTRSDLAPWVTAGGKSNATMMDLLGYNGPEARAKAVEMFRTDPGYQFSVDQGVKALDRSAIKGGNLYSGRNMMALNDYGRNMADQQYTNYYNRLADVSRTGQNSAAQVGSAGTNAAGAIGRGYLEGANMLGNAYNMQAQGYGEMLNAPMQAASMYMYGKGKKLW